MFSKFAEISPMVWGTLAALVIAAVILFALAKGNGKKKWDARMLANAAMCVALSFILSYIRLYKLPQGGSITLVSMLPIFLFSYAYGVVPGMLVGFVYGLLQFMQDAYFVHPIELVLDYPLAFAMLGLCGLSVVISKKWGFIVGILLGTFGRFICAFISGIIFFGMYAPEGQPVAVYSAVYNGLYLVPEALLCIVVAAVPQVRALAEKMAGGKTAVQ